jgi:hypothetical protein
LRPLPADEVSENDVLKPGRIFQMKLQASEEKALDDASLLIKYAAESPKTLPEKIMTPIADAWKAREESAWSPDVSSKFWIAYSALCDLLNPVTLETISAGKPANSRRWVFFGDFVEVTLAETALSRYRVLLLFLLATAVLFGFVVSTATKMSDDIKDFMGRGNTAALEAAALIATIKGELEKITPPVDDALRLPLDDSRIGADTRSKINSLREKLQDLYYVGDMMNERVNGITAILSFSTIGKPYQRGDLSRLPILQDGYANIQDYYQERRAVSTSPQSVFILNSFYNALVPMLFGAIGACTYVLRLISDQIRETTFSATSPIRHSVRVLLGALAGFAVGLGGIATSAALSAAALAFVSGYAIEPVFATMDGIAEKFRRA